MKTKNLIKTLTTLAVCGIAALSFAACDNGGGKAPSGDNTGGGNNPPSKYYSDSETEVVEGLTKNKSETEKTFYIYTAAGLRSFGEIISSESELDADMFADATVEFKADVNLAGDDWFCASIDRMGANNMIIDGKGHVISNMTASGSNSVGFIGTADVDKITIKNLTFDNATVTAGKWDGVVIGYQVGVAEIDNVTVKNSEVIGDFSNDNKPARLGGIIGLSKLDVATTQITINGCTVTGCTVTGYHNVAGLIGTAADWGMTWARMTLSNNTIKDNTFRIQAVAPQNAGEDGSSTYGSAYCCESTAHTRGTFAITEQWIADNTTGNVTENNTFVWKYGVEETPENPDETETPAA